LKSNGGSNSGVENIMSKLTQLMSGLGPEASGAVDSAVTSMFGPRHASAVRQLLRQCQPSPPRPRPEQQVQNNNNNNRIRGKKKKDKKRKKKKKKNKKNSDNNEENNANNELTVPTGEHLEEKNTYVSTTVVDPLTHQMRMSLPAPHCA
jgi:hypothetical protein